MSAKAKRAVSTTVDDAVYWPVSGTMLRAVSNAVYWTGHEELVDTVDDAVDDAVYNAELDAEYNVVDYAFDLDKFLMSLGRQSDDTD